MISKMWKRCFSIYVYVGVLVAYDLYNCEAYAENAT